MTGIVVPIGTRDLKLIDEADAELSLDANRRRILLDLWRAAYTEGREDANREIRKHLTRVCGTHGERSRSAAAIRAILAELSR